MTVPVLVLLGFAAWTLFTLCWSIGVYRWGLIFLGRASIAEWRTDVPQGSDWYQRAMRAHMNCVENLPLIAALVVALLATGIQSRAIDNLFIVFLGARVAQTLVHIGLRQTNGPAALRFALFFVQIICMTAIGVFIVIPPVALT